MQLVVDANIIFSALLKGKSLSMLIELKKKGIDLIVPDFLVEEFFRKAEEISKALGLSKQQTVLSFAKLLSQLVKVIPVKEYSRFLEDANKVAPHIKDVPYFALSLKYGKCPLWSREKRLKRQKIIEILNDREVGEKFLK